MDSCSATAGKRRIRRALTGARRLPLLASLALGGVLAIAALASADTLGPIDFESGYTTGNINGQNGWTKTGAYDVEVVNVSGFPAAAGYGFGTKALRSSDAITTGAFGDQTFSPGLANEAGETGADNGGFPTGVRQPHFEANFQIGTTQATEQSGLHMSISPDRGDGARMSYLRFEDHADGVHVFFDDVTDPGPVGTIATFNETDIATLSRAQSHSIGFSVNLINGPANDVVTVTIDGVLRITGTTWEDYYRFDPEQTPSGNNVPTVDKMLFRESGVPNVGNNGQGFLVDNIGTTSSALPPAGGGGTGTGAPAAGATAGAVSGATCHKKKGKKRSASVAKKKSKKCKRKKHKKHH
jgi:hypothetical protein